VVVELLRAVLVAAFTQRHILSPLRSKTMREPKCQAGHRSWAPCGTALDRFPAARTPARCQPPPSDLGAVFPEPVFCA